MNQLAIGSLLLFFRSPILMNWITDALQTSIHELHHGGGFWREGVVKNWVTMICKHAEKHLMVLCVRNQDRQQEIHLSYAKTRILHWED